MVELYPAEDEFKLCMAMKMIRLKSFQIMHRFWLIEYYVRVLNGISVIRKSDVLINTKCELSYHKTVV